MEESEGTFQVDLAECEREPIHIPNKIQRFGFLLAVDRATLQIVQCSTNVIDFIGIGHQQLLGQHLHELIEQKTVEKIQYAISPNGIGFHSLNPLKVSFINIDTKFKAVFHFSADVLVIEIEPAMYEDFGYGDFYNNVNIIIQEFNNQKGINNLCNAAAEQIKRITGYDRVMVYQFDKDWNGEVVAECKEEKLGSFLGLHFPASDIPLQARKLYMTNLIRIITDVNYQAAELLPATNPLTNSYLDLSQSFLRSVSPIHIEYLQNMGVTATLTASIIVEGQLWGLISCHHYSPKFVDYRLRTVAEHIAKLFAYHLHLLEDIDDYEYVIEGKNRESELTKRFFKDDDLFLTLSKHPNLLLGLNSASGVAIFYENNYYEIGIVPKREFINKLFNWLYIHHQKEIFHTDMLSVHFPEAEAHTNTASGILAMRLSKSSKNYIVWFKPEVISKITWAGNPDKKAIAIPTENGYRLSPRKSFQKWEKEVYAQAIPWKKLEIQIAQNIYKSILELLGSYAERLQQQKIALEIQVQERTLELQTIYEELQTTYEELQSNNEELRSSNDQLTESLSKIEELNSDLQHAQRKLKAVFDSTKDVHFLIDRDYRVLFFNRAAVNRHDHDELLKEGDSLLSYIGGDAQTQEKFKEKVQRAFAGEIVEVEEKITYSPTLSIWFKTEFHPVNEHGKIIGVALNITNIDSLKTSEERIKAQNEQLRKIAFIQSHDVRRPVATILGLISLFDKDDLANEFNGVILDKLSLATLELDEVIHRIVKMTYQIE